MQKNTVRLENEKITKLLIEFSVPATIGMLVNALYNIIDRIYIGNAQDLGPLGLAGITITFPITLLLMATTLLFSIGGATLFSIRLGQKNNKEASLFFGNAVSMIVLVSMAFMFFGLLYLKPLLVLFGASETVLPNAMEYMRIVLLPAVIVLPKIWGVNGILYAAPIADVLSATITCIWLVWELRSFKKKA